MPTDLCIINNQAERARTGNYCPPIFNEPAALLRGFVVEASEIGRVLVVVALTRLRFLRPSGVQDERFETLLMFRSRPAASAARL
jgi:hypothetical protein